MNANSTIEQQKLKNRKKCDPFLVSKVNLKWIESLLINSVFSIGLVYHESANRPKVGYTHLRNNEIHNT